MPIVRFAKYLGIFLGPACSQAVWHAPVTQFLDRIELIAASQAPPRIASAEFGSRAAPVLSYVAHLAPLPRSFYKRLPFALAKLFRVPPQATAPSDVYSAAEWGGPRVDPVEVTCAAALARSALATITVWRAELDELRAVARLESSLAQLATGAVSPAHWDSRSFAEELEAAAAGSAAHPVLADVMPGAVRKALRAQVAEASAPALAAQKAPFKLQRTIAGFARERFCQDTIPSLIRRRAKNAFHIGETPSDEQLTALKEVMAVLSVPRALAAFKTWSNAWTTSRRLHLEARQGCPFCRLPGQDDLEHFLRCPEFIAGINAILAPIFSQAVHVMPLRLLVLDNTIDLLHRLGWLVAAFMTYHAVRNENMQASQIGVATRAQLLRVAPPGCGRGALAPHRRGGLPPQQPATPPSSPAPGGA